ncbi:alpha/beta hydrolase family protein [Halalkalibacter alkalisediminis]|uniref:Alpha/beta hydrolase family protein n=1 Tax=Halalkalibacter alkalisediminis TaxID=935616 RepID=A0ABV6NFK9_9BACI|nr:alpha/beta hydrolase family protein [Halalkalibacter alkalisediminis]
MIFSKGIDQYALRCLHKTRSKNYQYSSLPIFKVFDRDQFYRAHSIDVTFSLSERDDYRSGTFESKSLISTGYPTNDKVIGEAFVNKKENVPNLIFVHGWRQDSFERMRNIFHDRLKSETDGNLYYFTLPYHFQRKPVESLFSGEYMISADVSRTLQAVQQAVVDLRAFIHWIKTHKKGPVILIGLSLGGFITNLTATLEPKIDALVSIFYSNRLSYSIWKTNPGIYIRADLEQHGVTYEDLVNYWQITEPSLSRPKVNKENILLISAKHDQYVDIEDANYLWESWERPTRYLYNCGHAGIVLKRRKIAEDTLAFLHTKIK